MTGEEMAVLTESMSYVTSASLDPDGRLVATGHEDGMIRLWSARNGEKVRDLRVGDEPVYEVVFVSGGTRLLTRDEGGNIQLWDMGTERAVITCYGVISSASDGSRIAVSGKEYGVRVWELPSGQGVLALQATDAVVDPSYPFPPRLFSISPKGQWLVGADESSGWLAVWEVAAGRKTITFKTHDRARWGTLTHRLAFSPDERWIATGGKDKTARVWEVTTGQQVALMRGHEDYVYISDFSPDGTMLLTHSDDGSARLWDASSGQPLAILQGCDAEAAAFSPNGRLVAVGCCDGTARIYAVHIEDLLDLARQRVTREFTCQERVQFLHEELECGE